MLSNNLAINITEYEEGRLNEKETIMFFQKLIDDKVIDFLQGRYQRQAERLIEEGLINAR